MSDPLGFPVLAGSAITQAFGFLYGRLAVLLDRRDASRSKGEQSDQGYLGQQAGPSISGSADETRLAELRPSLEVLANALEVYHANPAMLDGEDSQLRRNLGCLRAALEAIYHQQIAFAEEERRSPALNIEQEAEDLSGELIGAIIREVSRNAQVEVIQKFTKIHKGGKAVGARITRIE